MTIQTEQARQTYAGDGATVTFDYTARFLQDEHLLVYISFNDTEELQILNTDYTVSGAGDPSGGSITFVSKIPAVGETVTIINDPDRLQEIDYRDGDDFPAETHETGLDKLTLIAQRLADRVDRSLVLSDTGESGQSSYDIGGNRLANVADGTNDQDAATVKQFTDWTGQVAGDADRAETAATNAEAAEAQTLIYRDETKANRDEVTKLYLGPHSADPVLDNDGDPLQVGAYYFNTTTDTTRTCTQVTPTIVWVNNADLAELPPDSVDDTHINSAMDETQKENFRTKIGASDGTLPAGSIIQTFTVSNNANTSLTAVVPFDTSTPQITEGTQIFSQAITLGNAANTVLISVFVVCSHPTQATALNVSLFRVGTSSAIQTQFQTVSVAGALQVFSFEFEDTPGSVGPHTYTIRAGPQAGTMAINGQIGTQYGGPAASSTFKVQEIKRA